MLESPQHHQQQPLSPTAASPHSHSHSQAKRSSTGHWAAQAQAQAVAAAAASNATAPTSIAAGIGAAEMAPPPRRRDSSSSATAVEEQQPAAGSTSAPGFPSSNSRSSIADTKAAEPSSAQPPLYSTSASATSVSRILHPPAGTGTGSGTGASASPASHEGVPASASNAHSTSDLSDSLSSLPLPTASSGASTGFHPLFPEDSGRNQAGGAAVAVAGTAAQEAEPAKAAAGLASSRSDGGLLSLGFGRSADGHAHVQPHSASAAVHREGASSEAQQQQKQLQQQHILPSSASALDARRGSGSGPQARAALADALAPMGMGMGYGGEEEVAAYPSPSGGFVPPPKQDGEEPWKLQPAPVRSRAAALGGGAGKAEVDGTAAETAGEAAGTAAKGGGATEAGAALANSETREAAPAPAGSAAARRPSIVGSHGQAPARPQSIADLDEAALRIGASGSNGSGGSSATGGGDGAARSVSRSGSSSSSRLSSRRPSQSRGENANATAGAEGGVQSSVSFASSGSGAAGEANTSGGASQPRRSGSLRRQCASHRRSGVPESVREGSEGEASALMPSGASDASLTGAQSHLSAPSAEQSAAPSSSASAVNLSSSSSSSSISGANRSRSLQRLAGTSLVSPFNHPNDSDGSSAAGATGHMSPTGTGTMHALEALDHDSDKVAKARRQSASSRRASSSKGKSRASLSTAGLTAADPGAAAAVGAGDESRDFANASTQESSRFSGFDSQPSGGAGGGGGFVDHRRWMAEMDELYAQLKVKDFAFPAEDGRHVGVRDARLKGPAGGGGGAGRGAWLATLVGSDEEEVSEEEEDDGRGQRHDTGEGEQDEWGLSAADAEAVGEEEEEGAQEGLPLGIYEVLYAFEAESEHELSVEPGERVRVVGALDGGWAIVETLFAQGEAAAAGANSTSEIDAAASLGTGEASLSYRKGLVPESYLGWVEEDPHALLQGDDSTASAAFAA